MKAPLGKILTHLGAIGLGVLLTAWIAGKVADHRREGKGDAALAAIEESATDRAGRPERADRPAQTKTQERDAETRRFSSKDFKVAWDAIGRRDLTKNERVELQRQVLREWAKVDPEGALKAALASPWDDQRTTEMLLSSFSEYFTKSPVESWDLIKSGRLGVGATLVKVAWAYQVARENPGLVLSYLSEIPAGNQSALLQTMASYAGRDPAKREAFLAKLMEVSDEKSFAGWLRSIVPSLGMTETTTELRGMYAATQDPKKASLYLHLLGHSMKNSDLDSIRKEWSKLPSELQGAAARAITLYSDTSEPGKTPLLFDMLAKTSEWEMMHTEKWRLGRYADTPEKKEELAKWALNLPESPKTQEIFHRAVEPYIRANLDAAGDWIETLPRGWQRDRALAELSQQSLWRKGSTELSDWALGEIADPQLRADATKWRGDWAKQTGKAQ